MRWEYYFASWQKEGESGQERYLNELGAEGWELVQVVDGMWIFKRART